jgi:hypothetical protein
VSGSEVRQQQMEGAAAAQAIEADDGLAGAVPHPEGLLPIGVTTVCSLFSEDELAAIEKEAGAERPQHASICCLTGLARQAPQLLDERCLHSFRPVGRPARHPFFP